jgi:hypothetical protein
MSSFQITITPSQRAKGRTVSFRQLRTNRPMSSVLPCASCGQAVAYALAGYVQCVDGSGLARKIFTFASLVGAAMCSACLCGSHDRWQ